jgi:hypothetical protein
MFVHGIGMTAEIITPTRENNNRKLESNKKSRDYDVERTS